MERWVWAGGLESQPLNIRDFCSASPLKKNKIDSALRLSEATPSCALK
jgi:hypothetical protein